MIDEEEFWFVRLTFKDGRVSEHFCSADEYDDKIASYSDEDDVGLRKIEIEVLENSLVD